MSEMAGFAGAGSWLPASVQRRMAPEDAHERAEARRAKLERADQADQARERSLAAYRAAAEQRGEVVSAMALASGEVTGRDLGDVFADATAAADREDARQRARDRRESGEVVFIDEPVIRDAGRSEPLWTYEMDRELRRAHDLHGDLVQVMARADYPSALAAARRHSPHRHTAARSEYCVYCTEGGVDDDTSRLLHSDPEFNVPVTTPEQARQAELAERTRYGGQDRRQPMIYR